MKKIKEAHQGKWLNKFCKFVERHEWLIFILLVVAILRLPSLFEPNRYADEDIYLVLGQGLRKGLVFYRDIHDNKPPLLYAMAAVAGSVMWFRLILMFWNMVNVVLVWRLASKMITKSWAVVLVTALFGVFSTIPLLEGNIANGEIFMIMPVTAGVLILLEEAAKKKFNYLKWLGVGVLFAMGFLFKVPVLFDFFGVLFWLSFYQLKRVRDVWRPLFDKRIWVSLLGFIVPVLLTIVYYFAVGAGERYLRSALGQNIGYLASWEGGGGGAFYENGLFQRAAVMFGWMAAIWLMRHKLGKRFGLASLWLITALFGANLSGRPYPHYMIEILVPAGLMLGLVLEKGNLVKKIVAVGLAATIGAAVWRYDYWYYKSFDYYVNYTKYVSGAINKDEYYSFWGDAVLRNNRVAEYIRQRTDNNDRILVWGTEPAIYVLSDRLPVGRYTVAYHIRDFDGLAETVEALYEHEPKYIVVIDSEEVDREIDSYLSSYYIEVLEDGEATVWRRIVSNE